MGFDLKAPHAQNPVRAELVEASLKAVQVESAKPTTVKGHVVEPFWVYILRCSDNSYYTGHTDNLDLRIAQHVAGEVPGCYTFKLRPVTLVFSQPCTSREEALAAERQIKGWNRKKKEALMRGDWAEISRLAHSSFDKLRTNGD